MTGIVNRSVVTDLFKAAKTVISAEPVALYATQGKAAKYPVRKILAIYHYDATTGVRVDHPLNDMEIVNTSQIARTSGSGVYDFASYSITMTGTTYVLVTTPPRNPPITMNLLTYIDYETDYIAPVNVVGLATSSVTGLVITAGDSITGAAHTIRRSFAPESDADGYVGLLRTYFHKKVSVYNFSIDGSSMGDLTANMSSLLAMNPSVLTIAFGQNDHVAGPSGLASFKDALNSNIDQCQAAGVRNVLIGFMPKNPLWVNYSLANIISYNEAIAEVAAAQGVPFVDIYSAWVALRSTKEFIELTGDNHHHPNNYGQRLYFSKILPYLTTLTAVNQSIEGFVI